jgi:predicted GIY-YIG superfamily endonuclease
MAYVDSSMLSTTRYSFGKKREMNIKHWPRAWKVRLIHQDNPDWDDLYDRLA